MIVRCCLLVLALCKEYLSVKFDYLNVPGSVMKGDSVWLDCGYDLQEDKLYSVKWYKDNFEFYRYLPSDHPSSQMLDLNGVHLDLRKSNATHAFLNITDLDTAGSYACEVSTDAPSFRTVRAEKELRVYVLPKSDPVISGILNRHTIGDEINVTCFFGPSKPAAELTWYINGRQAPSSYVTEYKSFSHYQGVESVESRLQFILDPSHLYEGTLTIQCTASVSHVYDQGSEELVLSDGTSGAEFQRLMQVAPGQEGPSITGARQKYEVGDLVDVNCTSARSQEPAELSWFINEDEAKPEFLLHYQPLLYADARVSTRLGLRFRVHEDHFKGEEMRLKCTATLAKVVELSSAETVFGGSHRSSGLLHVSVNCGSGGEYGLITKTFHVILLILLALLASR